MEATNPHTARIDALNVEFANREAAIRNLQQQYAQFDSPAARATDQARAIANEVERLAELQRANRRAVADAQTAEAAWNAAVSNNIATGMTPEAAATKASADLARAEGQKKLLTYIGIGLLIVLLVAAFVWYRRKK